MAMIYQFGPYRLDAQAEILFRGVEPVELGQRAVALLRVLLERPGAPVSKDALIEAAWSGLSVEESNLPVQVAALRRIFREEVGGERWIETLPRRGYRYVGPPVATQESDIVRARVAEPAPAVPLPDIPSIAILPFQNLSGDSEQEYFADGIVEEITTALSRFRRLFVIARNSSFTYKGRAVDVKQVGQELGVRYVLEGSVRKAANQVRIAGQLVDASTGKHLWADRFDGALDDIFNLQDQVTASVIGAIAPKLEQAEIDRAKRKPTENLDAYDYYLRAMMCVHQWTHESISEALRLLYRAIELDPNFASAYGMAAWCYVRRKVSGWMNDSQLEMAELERLARRAGELADDDAVALCSGGFALTQVTDSLDAGAAMIDRALAINPNLTSAWFLSGWTQIYLGEPERAIEHFARAMRLNPLDPLMYRMQTGTAAAQFLAGRYEQSSLWAEKALRLRPNDLPSLRIAAASHALAGQTTEAKRAVGRLRQLDPALRVSTVAELVPFRRPEDVSRYAEGLQKAGLPE